MKSPQTVGWPAEVVEPEVDVPNVGQAKDVLRVSMASPYAQESVVARLGAASMDVSAPRHEPDQSQWWRCVPKRRRR
jgi:hypothetical protein